MNAATLMWVGVLGVEETGMSTHRVVVGVDERNPDPRTPFGLSAVRGPLKGQALDQWRALLERAAARRALVDGDDAQRGPLGRWLLNHLDVSLMEVTCLMAVAASSALLIGGPDRQTYSAQSVHPRQKSLDDELAQIFLSALAELLAREDRKEVPSQRRQPLMGPRSWLAELCHYARVVLPARAKGRRSGPTGGGAVPEQAVFDEPQVVFESEARVTGLRKALGERCDEVLDSMRCDSVDDGLDLEGVTEAFYGEGVQWERVRELLGVVRARAFGGRRPVRQFVALWNYMRWPWVRYTCFVERFNQRNPGVRELNHAGFRSLLRFGRRDLRVELQQRPDLLRLFDLFNRQIALSEGVDRHQRQIQVANQASVRRQRLIALWLAPGVTRQLRGLELVR